MDSNSSTATGNSKSGDKDFGEVREEARKTAKDLGQEAKTQARSTADYLREQANSSLHEGKDQVARQVEGLAQAFRKSGEELRNQELGRLADGSEWIASRVDGLQQYLREREPDQMLNDLRGVARRQPAWFLGGLFAAGLVAARFIQSGNHHGGSEAGWQGGGHDHTRPVETTRT